LLAGDVNEFVVLCVENVVVTNEPLKRFEYRMYEK
jgi:hypothetical protein